MTFLGVAASADLCSRWRHWLAPRVQPFFVDSLRPWPKTAVRTTSLSPELGHTYKSWNVDRSLKTLWLDEDSFSAMSRRQRAALVRTQIEHGRGAVPSVRRWSDVLDAAMLRDQADGHRFVWWPSVVDRNPDEILRRVIAAAPAGGEPGGLASRHREVGRPTWDRCTAALPRAEHLAGSFPPSSGPNCFGTVMAAAGVEGADRECMLQAPFLAWLDLACQPGGDDRGVGTVLMWRDRKGDPVHAAVTIGDGWALEKASAEWWTPLAVRAARDVIRTARARGQHLERHHIET